MSVVEILKYVQECLCTNNHVNSVWKKKKKNVLYGIVLNFLTLSAHFTLKSTKN